MSYTGFFADDDLYEVAKDGDPRRAPGWSRSTGPSGIADEDFVTAEDPDTGERSRSCTRRAPSCSGSPAASASSRRRTTPRGADPLRGRAGARRAARPGRPRPRAAEILELTVCEPALGSGAFAIEAIRQLAEEYLKRRQEELGERIDPDEYPRELQKVKAYLALHQVYGVDLNATAVELAEISLWLDTMVAGPAAPWFGLHLRRGNSLIGARREVYRRAR